MRPARTNSEIMRCPALLLIFTSLGPAQTLRVGTAEVVITPPAGMPMAGYYATRLMTGVHDDLHAKAIVISSGEQRAALVACDLIGIPAAVIEEARQLIQTSTGIPGDNVMISATHSHTGPLIPGGGARESAYGADREIAKQYRKKLPGKIAESVRLANGRLTPARAALAKGHEDSISFNRRFFMKDGTVGWNPGKLNPKIEKPAGPIDPEVPVVYFESLAGDALATYVNFALHLDTTGGLEASADYPYTLAKLLGKIKGPGMLTLFTIGAAGNINHLDVKSAAPQRGPEEAARIGTILAGEVVKTYARLEPVRSTRLQALHRTLTLDLAPADSGDEERASAFAGQIDAGATVKFLDTVFAFRALDTAARHGKPWDAEVQVIALGDQIAWVGLPGEIFTELGGAIKQASPFPMTIIVELAHGPVTYIPNAAAFAQGNYEVVSSRAAQGSGEKLVAAARYLLLEAARLSAGPHSCCEIPSRAGIFRVQQKMSDFPIHDRFVAHQ
jgi:neutral ceramidase